jgi:hypothetical protein
MIGLSKLTLSFLIFHRGRLSTSPCFRTEAADPFAQAIAVHPDGTLAAHFIFAAFSV